MQDTDGVIAALKKAARQAILEHARAGVPIVIWRDGQIVIEDARVHCDISVHGIKGKDR